ncbi:uncharacterized protein LOC130725408 [Lotus japonicus]|uniref:uncharacterized protein LOC130725408 n=1 Tax=Lotus japonicus TaxID=34305 RepID=UPI00258F4038|nr:uncharacterized protein LOC130725408 [Lotus japonicus]
MVHVEPDDGYVNSVGIFLHPGEEVAKIDLRYALSWDYLLEEKWYLEDPLHNIFVVEFNKDLNNPALQKGWKSLSEFYGLSGKHWCMLKMVVPCHFHMSISAEAGGEILYYRMEVPDSPPLFLPEDVDHFFADFSPSIDEYLPELHLDQVVPEVNSSPVSVLCNEVLDDQVVPEALPAPNGLPEGVVLQYHMGLNSTITPYRAYGSQYTLPRRVALYVHRHGLEPWVLRGPSGISRSRRKQLMARKRSSEEMSQNKAGSSSMEVTKVRKNYSRSPLSDITNNLTKGNGLTLSASDLGSSVNGMSFRSTVTSTSRLLGNGFSQYRLSSTPLSTSPGGISNVVNNSVDFSEKKRQCVFARARRLHYIRSKCRSHDAGKERLVALRKDKTLCKQGNNSKRLNIKQRYERSNVKKNYLHQRSDSRHYIGKSSNGTVVDTTCIMGGSVRVGLGNDSAPSESQCLDQLYQDSELLDEIDLGDASYTCRYCDAHMWYEERIAKSKRSIRPEFSLCCMKGKVVLPLLSKPPLVLYNLLHGIDPRSKHFKDNIRAYNSMFAFTSIGGKVESAVNNGGGPPQFVLSGQNYHRIGTLLPQGGQAPKFAQLYIYDTQNENLNRMKPFIDGKKGDKLDISLVNDLKQMIDENNILAKTFRKVRDYVMSNESTPIALRLFRKRGKDPRTYNLPTCDEIAALIIGDFDNIEVGRDIIVKKDGVLSRIHETHTSFIPLQYPLVFSYGEDGWQEDIPLSGVSASTSTRLKPRVTLREFITFRIQERDLEHGNVLLCRRLFQQFLVDCFTMIESQRLSFVRNNQKLIRADFLNGIEEAMDRGETDAGSLGTRIVLPSSFVGGRRYMFDCCQDAMAICKRYGYPDLFITFTCNSVWKEIDRFVRAKNLRPDERPDICCRVFKMKLDHLVSTLKSGIIFGPLDAGMYTIEFQKRGLPHAHILLWLSKDNKLVTTSDIDKCISAEIPDPILYPKLNKVVCNYMLHGPCGREFLKSPCMSEGKCTKFFPKKFQESTVIDEDGYPLYKRRDTGIYVEKKGIRMDNSFVVPYNPQLLMLYNGHINVEYCNKSNAIKYLFKYVSKGPDRVNLEITNQKEDGLEIEVKDEIKQYYDCRYLTPCEAVWRTFKYYIHVKWPAVLKVTFHLQNNQSVCFEDNDNLQYVVEKAAEKDTMFIAWMRANAMYEEGKGLTYSEFPSYFVFDEDSQSWHPRKNGYSIGRLQYIPHGVGELYYLRILLTRQKGCTSWESIRTIEDVVYASFHDACYALGLLADDREFIDAIIESNDLASGIQLRKFFVMLLTTNTMSKPEFVWEKSWRILCDGIVYERRKKLRLPDLHIKDEDLKNLCLVELEKLLHLNGRSLKDYPCLPYSQLFDDCQYVNKFIADELNYDKVAMANLSNSLLSSLTEEQHQIYNEIMKAVLSQSGGLFFLYGFGGTGKTYLWNTLSAAVRAEGLIVLNVASSGIASLLLPGGRTAHSRFSIPISIKECSTCNVAQGSLKAELLQKTSLIIWDEAPMLNRFCFEALDRTMTDLMKSYSAVDNDKPFGGKVVVLGGDFRQILPVIQKGSRCDIVNATINSSYLWKQCQVLRLTKNLRLMSSKSPDEHVDIQTFADWLLNIGDGKVNTTNDGVSTIEIPNDLLISSCDNPLQSLIDFAYPYMLQSLEEKNYKFFEERAILAPTLESVEVVNNEMLSKIPGGIKEYFSCDSTCKSDDNSEVEAEWFTSEFLNNIKCSGIPNHKLILKVGVPIMLLRNIDQAGGLCNGTRMIVKELGKNVIVANVVSGKQLGEKVLISRMDLIPTDSGLPFKFVRRQFPISLCFAMTINKSQGQTLSHVGLFLPKPVFTHGQLYVALSRVKSRKGLKVLILDEDGSISKVTKNVVYKEVFDNV